MKANRSILKARDEAVSPVIGVILMVAVTVVLAATVYVWVSGFSGGQNTPARSIALSSEGPGSGGLKSYVVSAAANGMKWGDVTFSVNGETRAIDGDGDCTTAPAAGQYQPCAGSSLETDDGLVNAGDRVRLAAQPGDVLRVLDAQANSVIYTLTVG